MQTKAMAMVGFLFYTDDKLWTMTEKHRKFHFELVSSGKTRLQGETFFLAEETEQGAYVAGLSVADTYGPSVRVDAPDLVRHRLLNALKKAGIIIPATYGPDLYLTVQVSSFDDADEDEIPDLTEDDI